MAMPPGLIADCIRRGALRRLIGWIVVLAAAGLMGGATLEAFVRVVTFALTPPEEMTAPEMAAATLSIRDIRGWRVRLTPLRYLDGNYPDFDPHHDRSKRPPRYRIAVLAEEPAPRYIAVRLGTDDELSASVAGLVVKLPTDVPQRFPANVRRNLALVMIDAEHLNGGENGIVICVIFVVSALVALMALVRGGLMVVLLLAPGRHRAIAGLAGPGGGLFTVAEIETQLAEPGKRMVFGHIYVTADWLVSLEYKKRWPVFVRLSDIRRFYYKLIVETASFRATWETHALVLGLRNGREQMVHGPRPDVEALADLLAARCTAAAVPAAPMAAVLLSGPKT